MEDNELEKNEKDKNGRILALYSKLINGRVINKEEEAKTFDVSTRSIQRDLEDIRRFLDNQVVETGINNSLIFDYKEKGYRLEQVNHMKFTNDEVLAISKILLDSRAFTKSEMMGILDKLLDCCVPKKNQKMVNELISNERFHYIEPQHKKVFIDKMWTIGQAIKESKVIEITYTKMKNKETVERRLEPLAIMFSEYYFYLVGFIENIDKEKAYQNPEDPFPTIYRIDRIEELKVLEEHFSIPYKDRFEEGNSEKEYNLCMVENYRGLGLNILANPLKQFLTDYQQRRLYQKKMVNILSKQKCLVRELRCG